MPRPLRKSTSCFRSVAIGFSLGSRELSLSNVSVCKSGSHRYSVGEREERQMTRVSSWALVLGMVLPGAASAELVTLHIQQREPYASGVTFGDVGAYEKVTGIARFAVDPGDPHNAMVVDLSL